jgi:hypothetical protein
MTTRIWRDEDFRSLGEMSQHLFFLLATQPETTHVGSLPLTARRWSTLAAGLTEQGVRESLTELAAADFVLVDEDSEEVLVLDYLQFTGRGDQPNVIRAAYVAAQQIKSRSLRDVAVSGLELPECQGEVSPADLPSSADEVPDYEDPGTHTPGIVGRWIPAPDRLARTRLAVFVRDNWTCRYCSRVIAPRTDDERTGKRAPMDGWDYLELDHVHPYSRGGGFTVDNLAAACSPCNRSKSNKTAEVHP